MYAPIVRAPSLERSGGSAGSKETASKSVGAMAHTTRRAVVSPPPARTTAPSLLHATAVTGHPSSTASPSSAASRSQTCCAPPWSRASCAPPRNSVSARKPPADWTYQRKKSNEISDGSAPNTVRTVRSNAARAAGVRIPSIH